MTSIGESLRQERKRRDLDLEQISRELKISSRFLEAIEEERFDKLPGGVFAKSFVRQYARYLGLDDDEYAAAVQQVVEPHAGPQSLPSHSLAPVDIALPRVEEWQSVAERRFNWSSSLPALALVVIAMLACSGVYTLWQRSRRAALLHEDNKPAAMETVHASAPATQPQPAQAPPAQPPAETAAQQPKPVEARDSATSAPAPSTPVSQPAPSPVADANRPAPQSPAPAAPAQADTTNPGAAVKVELTATEPVWVLARADGKVLFSGTIDANQSRTLEAAGTLTLRLGNAGGVNITLNGKPIGPVGPKGQVRTVQFTSGGFQMVAPPKPSAPPPDPL